MASLLPGPLQGPAEGASAAYATLDFILLGLSEAAPIIGQLIDLLIFVWDILNLLGIFSGKPRALDTITVAQRLAHSKNAAGQVWAHEIMWLLNNMNIVLSSSDADDQKLIGEARHQFIVNLVNQGVTMARARNIASTLELNTQSANDPLPRELNQEVAQDEHLWGSQQFEQTYQSRFQELKDQGKTDLDAFKGALRYAMRTSGFKQLLTITVAKQNPFPPPPPPPPPPPIIGTQSGGDELTDCCQNLSNAVAQLGQTLSQLLGQQGGQGAQPTADCCQAVVTSIDGVSAAITSIAESLPAAGGQPGSPVDLTPVVDALSALKTALTPVSVDSPAINSTLQDRLSAIADAIGKNPPTDVSGIVKELHRANQDADVPQSIIDQLIKEGAVSGELGQLISGAPWERVVSGALASIGRFLGGELGDIEHGLGKLLSNLAEPAAEMLWRALQKLTVFINNQEGQVWDAAKRLVNTWNSKVAADAGPGAGPLKLIAVGFEDLAGVITEYSFGELAELFFTLVRDPLVHAGEATPDGFQSAAQIAYGNAFAAGMIAHILALLFDAFYFTKQTGLPALAAAVAELAGFAEISKAQLAPYYDAAIRTQARYDANSKLKPEYPAEFDATLWRSRQLISENDLKEVFKFSPLKTKYETAYLASAFRAVSPFILARAAETGAITNSDLLDVLTFGGIRPIDQQRLLAAFNEAAIDPYKKQTLAALLTAAERGTVSDAEIDSALDSLEVLPAARPFLKQTIAYRRLEQLDTLYRKSISEAYRYGLISDSEYIPAMTNAGVAQADAQAHYAVDSIAKQGREAQTAARAAAKLLSQQERAAVEAAEVEYFAGSIDEAGLALALAGAGIDPTIAGFRIAMATARKQLKRRWIYGLLLPPAQAGLLHEQVAVIKEQVAKKLIDATTAIAQLAGLNIPGPVRENLVASWAAAAYKELLPLGQ